jgi:hypothetical protein
MPKGARVLEPVVPVPAKYIVSVVIAIVIVAPDPAMNVRVVPIGSARFAFELIVTVRVAEA